MKKIYPFLIVVLFFSCVPMRKQIILQDKSRKTLKALQQVDTVLKTTEFKYKLKPRDMLSVTMNNIINKTEYDISALSGGPQNQSQATQNGVLQGYEIDSLGKILLPILGYIKVEGLSVQEAERQIQLVATKYIDNIVVNVKMLNYYVYVIGETNLQGRLIVNQERITLLEAIALSGGFKEFANRAKIKIIRNLANKTHIYYVDFLDQNLLSKPEIYLLPGDVIVVDPLRSRNVKNYTLTNLSLFVTTLSVAILLFFNLRNLGK